MNDPTSPFAPGTRSAEARAHRAADAREVADASRAASPTAADPPEPHACSPEAIARRAEHTPILSIDALSKRFGDVEVLKGVSLDIAPGEIFALLGPSGCGKSTLLRLVAGFETPSSGTIRLDGEDMTRLPPNRRPVNMVFQSYAVFPHMTVAENVGYGLTIDRVARAEIDARVAEALEQVRLDGYGARRPEQLSGGQRQRVALARALIKRPRLLLLDEPLSALDAKLRDAMRLELVKLQETVGITFVIVTHDQNEAMAMADRVAVLEGGRLRQVASPAELYRRPADAFVADFIGSVHAFEVRTIGVGGGTGGAPAAAPAASGSCSTSSGSASFVSRGRCPRAARPVRRARTGRCSSCAPSTSASRSASRRPGRRTCRDGSATSPSRGTARSSRSRSATAARSARSSTARRPTRCRRPARACRSPRTGRSRRCGCCRATPRGSRARREPCPARKPAERPVSAARPAGDGAADDDLGAAAHLDVLVVDWHGRLRGKRLPMAQRAKLEAGESRLPLSTQAQDIGDDDRDELTGLGLSIGDPDGLCVIEPRTLRRQPWNPRVAQALASLHGPDGAPSPFDSRAVLARQVARFAERGWRAVVAVELEFYLLDASTRTSGRPAVPERLRIAGAHGDIQLCEPRALDRIEGVLDRIHGYARALALPVETMLAEIGPGQFEINLAHRDDPLRAADEALLFRRVVDRAAFEEELLATFMAKPYTEHDGSGQHVHVSVLDGAGDNVLDAAGAGPARLRHAVAGLLDTLEEVQLLLAPHGNSYRRLQPGGFAPCRVDWGLDHRGVSIRLPATHGPAARLEHRVAGADANGHLVLAAILAGVLEGLERGEEPALPALDPGVPPSARHLTHDWVAAIDRAAASGFVRALLGARFLDAYIAIKRHEARAFNRQVTEADWQACLTRV